MDCDKILGLEGGWVREYGRYAARPYQTPSLCPCSPTSPFSIPLSLQVERGGSVRGEGEGGVQPPLSVGLVCSPRTLLGLPGAKGGPEDFVPPTAGLFRDLVRMSPQVEGGCC
jgi:hypothetical protein